MRRTFPVIFCILIMHASSLAQFQIADCKTGSFHDCTDGVNNFPLPQGAWVDFFHTSCATQQTNVHKHVVANDSGCLEFWFDCLSNGYEKEISNDCTQTCVTATYLCSACT